MRKVHFRGKHASAGQSVIELAIILPILLILLLGVADFARAILFNNILVNMSREGANLAARTTQSPQFIIDALNHTAAPLQMEAHGMVYIARVKGFDGGHNTVVARVDAQYRATNGNMSLTSTFWPSCPSFTSGSCNMPTPANCLVTCDVTSTLLPITLGVGDVVFVVETIYDYAPLSKYVMQTDLELYSRTLL